MPELNRVKMLQHPRIHELVKKHNIEVTGMKTKRLKEMINREPIGRSVTKVMPERNETIAVPHRLENEVPVLRISHITRNQIINEVVKQVREKNADAFEKDAAKLFGAGPDNVEIKFERGEQGRITGITVHTKR